jgi:hypothetical protein
VKKSVLSVLVVLGLLFTQIEVFADQDVFLSIKMGTLDDIKTYLKNGGDVNAKDENGKTLLIWAALIRDADFVKLLIDANADVNQTQNGFSALMAAAAAEKPDIVKLLINAHADVNAKNQQGYTALILTASNGNTEIVKLLIDAKADITIKDNKGNTAIQWATANGHSEIAKMLSTHANLKNSNQRIVAGKWAFTLISVKNEGPQIVNTLGTWQYTYRANNNGETLVRITVELEQLDGKPINDGFLSIDVKVKDSAGKLFQPLAAGTDNSDYYVFSKGGKQSLMLPVQPKAKIDFVFSVPIGVSITELQWPGIPPLSIHVAH